MFDVILWVQYTNISRNIVFLIEYFPGMGLDKEDRSYCLMARAPIRQLLGLAEGSWSIFFFNQDPSNMSDSVDTSISEEVLYPILQEP